MPNYRRGSKAPEVERLQTRLKDLGYYLVQLTVTLAAGPKVPSSRFKGVRASP
jgi:peptidoglycan hydrolase-like protein with peptidoglycan-binding domain